MSKKAEGFSLRFVLINTGNISRKVLSKVLRSFDKNFERLHEEYPGLFAYEREVNGKGLLVIVNFTNEKLMFQKIDQKCELCNYHETESEWLQPYEARIYSK